MFNAPRPAQRYNTSNNNFGGSYTNENPLSTSIYDSYDPWSAAPSPAPPAAVPAPSSSAFGSVIGADAAVPSIYTKALAAVDPNNTGETSVNALNRVLATSSLSAGVIDKIVNLVSSRPRVSKLEFYVALALVALAQSGKDLSIEQVAALSQQNALPEPFLNLEAIQTSQSTFYNPPSTVASPMPIRRDSAATRPALAVGPAPAYSSEDPWNTNSARYQSSGPSAVTPSGFEDMGARGASANGVPSALAGTGLPREWWRKQETVRVRNMGLQGFILNRYTVYEVTTDRGGNVARRYSEFVFLWDCLVRRYPFRLFPSLPPKRIGPDEYFLEQRRKGLSRAINFVVNHPIIKDDGLLAIFLSEPSFENWRKHNAVALEEESASKRVDRIEEMTIPADLEDKLAIVRGKINPLIDHWQRICILAERIIKRRESAVGDMARLTNTLRAVIEGNERSWRGEDDELSSGVRQGLGQVADHFQRYSDLSEPRSETLLDTTLELLKTQRDLYIAMRDLFIRHDRLSPDQVERLKKRVDTTSHRLEGIKVAQKEGWQDEADRLIGLIEKDQATIISQLSRRVFIRACMWHELRVVLHNRENTLLSVGVQTFAREEAEYTERVLNNWISLSEAVESMPYE